MAIAVEGLDRSAIGGRAEGIHSDLVTAILEQRLGPDTKLGEDEVGAIFGVSRTIVRAVLQTLAHEGIVVIEKNRGAFVAHPSIADAREVLQARHLIETAIVARLAETCDEATAAVLQSHLQKEQIARSEEDEAAAVRLSSEFHLLLAELAQQKVYESMVTQLVVRSSLAMRLYCRVGHHDCIGDHHHRLVDAIVARSAVRATTAMVDHLEAIEAELAHVDTAVPLTPLSKVLGTARRMS